MNEMLVDRLLSASAGRYPERTAVVDEERSLTFAELEAMANRLAHLLVAHGVSRGDRVGLYLEKSLEAVVGIYGIMKAGAAYVPLDAEAPAPRLASIARDADLRCLVTSRGRAEEWCRLVEEGARLETLIALDAPSDLDVPAGARLYTGTDLDDHPADGPPDIPRSASDLAYILYTSGSTGTPKGVMLTHENALAFVDWAAQEFAVTAGDRLSSHAPLHFDLSVFDLFAGVRSGAAVVLVPSQLALFPIELTRWIRDSAISVWYSVPSILTLLVLRGKLAEIPLPQLRTILFAGEVFPTKHLHQLMELLPRVRFANLFGPTETNVCTWYEIPRWPGNPPPSIPIGKPIAGVEVFAVADDGAMAAPGEVGELYVRGPTVMQGYWGDAERTARSLIRDWQGRAGGYPVYRTGDLAYSDEDGDWIFLGRRDAQIKSRGYRIELGDIEATLNEHPAVVECAVAAIPDDVVTNRIKAFVVARAPVEEEELSRFCHERLPHYMAPEMYDFRSELPRSSTGKVDRRALAVTNPAPATGGR